MSSTSNNPRLFRILTSNQDERDPILFRIIECNSLIAKSNETVISSFHHPSQSEMDLRDRNLGHNHKNVVLRITIRTFINSNMIEAA